MRPIIRKFYITALGLGILALASCAPSAQASTGDPSRKPVQAVQASAATQALPTAPAGDVYLTADNAGDEIRLNVGENLIISLEGNPTTGFSWEAVPVATTVLELQGEPTFVPTSEMLGSSDLVSLVFKATASGQQTLSLIYHRPFEKDTPPESTFDVTVIVSE